MSATHVRAALVVGLLATCCAASAQVPIPRPTPLPDRPVLDVERAERLRLPTRVGGEYVACNLLQIHAARAGAWRQVYLDLGATAADVEGYVREMEGAAADVCAGRAGSGAFARRLGRIEAFRAGVDERMAQLLDVPVESAAHLRLGALDALDRETWQECFSEPAEAVDLVLGRLPLTPDVAGFDVTPATAALGQCGGSGGGAAGGRGAPPTLQVGAGLRATQACLTSLATQASTCDSPVGMSQEEARRRVEIAEDSCRSGAGNCSIYTEDNDDGSTTTQIDYAGSAEDGTTSFHIQFDENADGEITSVEFQFQKRRGAGAILYEAGDVAPSARSAAEQNAARALPQSAPSVGMVMDPTAWVALRTAEETLGLDRGTLAPPVPWQINLPRPGGRLQCEAFAGGDGPPAGLLRGPEASAPASGVGPGVPGLINSDDAIAYCLCQGGALGRQLAGAMGFGCPSPASDYAKRLACFESSPVAQPPAECAAYADEAGLDLASMCASTVRCPEGTTATGAVVEGRLSCGCGRTGTGGGRGNQCAAVQCPPPGTPVPESAEACCGAAAPITATPRLEALRGLRVRFGDAEVPALALPDRLDGRLRDRLRRPGQRPGRRDDHAP